MKKILVMILSAVVLLSLAGCGDNSSTAENTETTTENSSTEAVSAVEETNADAIEAAATEADASETDIIEAEDEEKIISDEAADITGKTAEAEETKDPVDFAEMPSMTVRLNTGNKYDDGSRRTGIYDLLGQSRGSIYTDADGVSQETEYSGGSWSVDGDYDVYSDNDLDFYFDKDGTLISVVNGSYTFTYAAENEYPGAVFKYVNGNTNTYFDASMKPVAMVSYKTSNATGQTYISDEKTDYCVSGDLMFYSVNVNGGRVHTTYVCEPEYDEDGNLIRETHYECDWFYEDGSTYKEYEDGEKLDTIKLYSYQEGVLSESSVYNITSVHDDTLDVSVTKLTYDQTGRVTAVSRFSGTVDKESLEMQEDTLKTDEEYDRMVFEDVTVAADPLLIAYMFQYGGDYPILPAEEIPAVTYQAAAISEENNYTHETDLSSFTGELNIGDIVTFGAYNQDGDFNNGPEPLEWIVVSAKDHQLRLVAKNALAAEKFNDTQQDVTWESCSLRTFLNSEFIDGTFTEEEAALIAETENKQYSNYNIWSSVEQGNDTTDKVFLLSYEEFLQYLGEGSDYAKAVAVDENGNSEAAAWCLRTMYDSNRNVRLINGNGENEKDGQDICTNTYIRPCLVINLPDTASTPDENGSYFEPGDIVTLGNYEQDNDSSNGAEAMEWVILGKFEDDGYYVLINKYVLDWMPYNDSTESVEEWENSTIYAFLNDNFYQEAFSEEEAALIKDIGNGNVFLLGSGALENYGSRLQFAAAPTAFAIAKGASSSDKYLTLDGEPTASFWLRDFEGASRPYNCPTYYFTSDRKRDYSYWANDELGIRPCISVDFEAFNSYFADAK